MNTSPVPPKNCTFKDSEWKILSRFWHPVLVASDLKEKPLAAELLDQKLVAYRTSKGVTVAKNLCLHRGARLSLGWIVGDELVCGFHGFRYDRSGACVHIPAHPDQSIPKKLCLTQYDAVERYGLIWVCLNSPAPAPLPDWPEMDNPALVHVALPPVDWNSSAGRQIENFNDVAHLSWVHTGTFGHRERPKVDRYTVEDAGNRLTALIPHVVLEDRFLGANKPGIVSEVSYRYDCDLPFASRISIDYGQGHHVYVFNVACPVSSKRTRIFEFYLHNLPDETPKQDLINYNLKALEEDQPFVESQCPEDLPLDLRAEVHIPADRLSIEYRKKLAALGLGPDFSA